MKMPIAWHVDCLENCKKSLARKRDHLARLTADADRDAEYVKTYEKQINNALLQGKDGFDSSKFGIVKKGATP
jgi:hypothetical protein